MMITNASNQRLQLQLLGCMMLSFAVTSLTAVMFATTCVNFLRVMVRQPWTTKKPKKPDNVEKSPRQTVPGNARILLTL